MGTAARVQAPRQRQTYLRFLVTLVLIVGILYVAQSVIVPLALAALLTFILTPLVMAVQRRGLRRVPAVLLVVSLALGLSGVVGWGVGTQVSRLGDELPKHTQEIKTKIGRLRGSGTGALSRLLKMFHEIGETPADPAPAAGGAGAPPQERVVVSRPQAPSGLERLSAVAVAVLEPIAEAGLVLVLVIFMLIKREDLRNRIIGLLGHGRLTGTTRVIVEAAQRLSRFLLMQVSVNAGFGVVFGLALLLIGVPYWFLWGFLTAVLRFVPYIGSWMAAAFPVILSFAISPGWTQPVVVLGVFLVLDLLTANALEPLLFGHSTGVSPIALLVAAAFWAWIWGPIGLVLSTPLTVCLVVLGQHVPRLKFLSLLLGDEPALEPRVAYYQRLLAGDRDEAAAVVKQHALAAGADRVPDDVLVPALRLARRDRAQAGLTAEGEAFIFDTTRDILDRLKTDAAPQAADAPADDAEPRGDGSPIIFGLPAHHQAEELTLHMLTQVMKPLGCQVEAISTRTLPVEIEARIEREKPALVFIAVLPPGGVVQASYLCRRLRKRFADLKIVVGYWGRARNFDALLVRLRAAGASYVTTSLLQSRSQIKALLAPTPASPGREPEPAGTSK